MTAYLHGTNGVIFPDSTTLASRNDLFAYRNKIINGGMDISQRGTSFAAPVSGTYTLDRWVQFNTSAAVYTITQQADVPSSNEFQNSLRVAITTADTSIAAGDLVSLRQWVEGYNARDLIGKTFTVSFWVRSSKTGIHCLSVKNTGADRTYVAEYTVNAANTWEYKTIAVTGGLITAGTWNWTNGQGATLEFALAAGSTFQTTAGAWQTGNLLATANQVNCLDTIGNIFAITGVQLELGSVATPFEHRPYGMELALCQRYLPVISVGSAVSAALYGYWDASNVATIQCLFPVDARVPPTSVVSTPSSWNVNNSGVGNPAATSINISGSGAATWGATLDFTVAASGSSGGKSARAYPITATSLIFNGCEL